MVYNKSAHIQIERKARRTWRTRNIMGNYLKQNTEIKNGGNE